MLDGLQVLGYRSPMKKTPLTTWRVGNGTYAEVTERQAEVLTLIAEHIDQHDEFPTFDRVAYLMGAVSTNAVADLFKALIRRGAMVRTDAGGYALIGRRRSDLLRRIAELEGRIANALT